MVWVTTGAAAAPGRLAGHYAVPQREMLEKLITLARFAGAESSQDNVLPRLGGSSYTFSTMYTFGCSPMRYLVIALLMSGCATPPPSKTTYWEKPGAGQAEFNADIGFCRAQAFSVPGAMNNLAQAVIVQSSCMQGKGWYLVER
jgi:hypothetical protein